MLKIYGYNVQYVFLFRVQINSFLKLLSKKQKKLTNAMDIESNELHL